MTGIDAVIVGAGAGTRLGLSTPKAFADLCGKPIVYYSLKIFANHPSVDRTILVVPPAMIDEASGIIGKYDDLAGKVSILIGGVERWESVRNGCAAAKGEWVLVHDAARPFVSNAVIDSVLEKRGDFDCVITATPVTDTIRAIGEGGRCGKTVDRSTLMRVGTPQLFRRARLMPAFDLIKDMPSAPTDEAALFERLGIDIGYSWGDAMNFKITDKADLKTARAIAARAVDG
ncbi:2-C-methyl-D-erythritol 4-phosphate cytidylyltransferase [Fibrobacteres bacterium R8-0-B4]